MLKDAQMSMQEIASFLLSDHKVTEDVTGAGVSEEIISATESATQALQKRRRGRPPKSGEAMTAAERARRYRRKHAKIWRMRRVDIHSTTLERVERVVAETGFSLEDVIFFAVSLASPAFWEEMKEIRIRLNKEQERERAQRRAQADIS